MSPPHRNEFANSKVALKKFVNLEFANFASVKMQHVSAGKVTCANIDRCKNALAGQERRNCSQWRQLIHSGNIHKMYSFSREYHDTL